MKNNILKFKELHLIISDIDSIELVDSVFFNVPVLNDQFELLKFLGLEQLLSG